MDSPTSDAVDIPLSELLHRFKEAADVKPLEVCVRTRSSGGESVNSNVSLVDVRKGAPAVVGVMGATGTRDLDSLKESVIDDSCSIEVNY